MDIMVEIDSNTAIVEDTNTPLINRSSRPPPKKTWTRKLALNDTLGQINLIYIFREFYPKAAEYTFFSSAHGTLSRIDHMLGPKTNLSKFKKTEIISNIFSGHMAWNYKSIKRKCKNTWAHGG